MCVQNQTEAVYVIEQAVRLQWKWTGHSEHHEEDRWSKEIGNWYPYFVKDLVEDLKCDGTRKYAAPVWKKKTHDRESGENYGEAYIQKWSE